MEGELDLSILPDSSVKLVPVPHWALAPSLLLLIIFC
jgi:hypothetical protein